MIVLDLFEVSFLGAAALGLFEHAHQHTQHHGRTPRLVTGSRHLDRVLGIAGIQPAPDIAPRAVVKPIAAGEKVVVHPCLRFARFLRQYCSDAVAVEVEGHGFLHGAYVNPGVEALVIRGIGDRSTPRRVTISWSRAATGVRIAEPREMYRPSVFSRTIT